MNEWDILSKNLSAQRQRQSALDEYNRAQAAAANQNQGSGNWLFDGIGSVLAGIGNSINNVGTTLYNMGGTGIASIRDLVTGNAGTGKYQNEWKEYMKGAQGDENMSDKDYYLKTGGKALDAAATVSDFVPGMGKGLKAAVNVGQGIASGAANQLIEKGSNATFEDLAKGAIVGGAGAGVGQAVGGKLANKAANSTSKGLVSRALQSNIGRGAITGATSGAVGAGLSTGLEGGDLGQVLSAAASGAGQGAVGGATTSAIYGLAGNALNKAKGKLEDSWATKAAITKAKDAGMEALAKWAKTPDAYTDNSAFESRRQKAYEDAYIAEAKRQGLSDSDIKKSMKTPDFNDALEWANRAAERGFSQGMTSTGASRDLANLRNYASSKVEDFLAKNGGMASDGEINGVYEDEFIKEATRAGLTNNEINNALNDALRTDDVDYMGNRARAAKLWYDDGLAPALDEAKRIAFDAEREYYAKNNLGEYPESWNNTGDTFDKAYVKRAHALGLDDDIINMELNYQKGTKNVDYVNGKNSAASAAPAAPAGGDDTVPTKPATMAEGEIPAGTKRRQTAMGWNDESLSGAAKKKNYFQQLGSDLQDAATATRDSVVYGRLKGNTADEMIKKDVVNNLRKNYGYSPDDYGEASKLSTAINKWYDNEIQSSGADKINTKLSSDLALPDNNTLPEKYEKAYKATIKNAMNMANAGDSDVIDKYTAAGLERAAKYLGEQEQKMRRTNMNGVGGRPDGDRAELADYYKNARQILRNEVDSMIELDDITKSNLAKMLNDAGATDQAKKSILSAQTFSQVKSATAPLEDARTMYRQIKSSPLKRSAAGDNSMSLPTQVANKTGLNNVLDVFGKPVRSMAAAGENALGKVISGIGNAAAGDGSLGKIGTGIQNVAKAAETGLNSPLGSVAMNQISRQAALGQQNMLNDRINAANAQEALLNAENNLAAANAAQQQALAATQQATANNPLTRIQNAMTLALNAGDFVSYQKLASLYQDAAKIYDTQNTDPMSKLSSSQIENVNKLDTASNAIDELEALFNKAGGGQGLIGGNVGNFMAALGLNSDVSTYNSISRGLINQIGAAIGKTDSLNTEGEVNRALELIPKFTDDAQTAKNKLAQLRQMLNTNKQTVYQNYGLI